MVATGEKHVEYLIVDTSAFIRNAPLQNVSSNLITCKEVVNEITNKRQLRRLVTLPYDLQVKEAYPEYVQIITEFSKKTGDYPSLSATDIKVMALTYQLEKEHVGVDHLRTQPLLSRAVNIITNKAQAGDLTPDVTGFYLPNRKPQPTEPVGESRTRTNSTASTSDSDNDSFYSVSEELSDPCAAPLDRFEDASEHAQCDGWRGALAATDYSEEESSDEVEENDESDDAGWITPANIQEAKKHIDADLIEERHATVACMTSDFAMQNVLKQMNLNVTTLDGRMIRQLRTFILRCYGCFKTTSVMTKQFCPNCGNKTLKRVSVSLNEEGKQIIHINGKKPLTRRGKKFSLPTPRGGKHANNPILAEDQPVPDQRPTRLARTKTNALDDEYMAGYSPFVMRDVTSKSAQLKIRPNVEVKHWMRKNPNGNRRRRRR